MGEARLAFHAHPPPGHWINDPNGLVYRDGAFHLFAQHRVDAPDFRATGWARFTSPDLLHWCFDGPVIPPDGSEWAYSGSVFGGGRLEALHTAHADRIERQVRRISIDGGLSWSAPEELTTLGAPARNRRDPFIFAEGDGWGLLLAEPCDWTDWASAPPSRLRRYRSADRLRWEEVGTIGPWRPAGIMWEVPVLFRAGALDVLIVSEVDRREGRADCSVRAWIGTLSVDTFTPADPVGQRVDLGPDFYALMTSSAEGWPLAQTAAVAWLSNWNSARTIGWPGFAGGPISLPRVLSVEERDRRLTVTNRPHPAVVERFVRPVQVMPDAGMLRLTVAGDRLVLRFAAGPNALAVAVDWNAGRLRAERSGVAPWQTEHEFVPSHARELLVFRDDTLVELFVPGEGLALSAIVPGEGLTIDVLNPPTEGAWYRLAG